MGRTDGHVTTIAKDAAREIRDGITTSDRFNAVVETGAPGFIPRAVNWTQRRVVTLLRFDVCLWPKADIAVAPTDVRFQG
jgi:hypothetical protein